MRCALHRAALPVEQKRAFRIMTSETHREMILLKYTMTQTRRTMTLHKSRMSKTPAGMTVLKPTTANTNRKMTLQNFNMPTES